MNVSVGYACLPVCLSTGIPPKLLVQSSPIFLHITYGRAWLDHPLAALRWPEIGDAEKAHTQSGPAGGNKDLHRGVHSIRGYPITSAAKRGGGTPPEIGFTRKFLAAPLS